MWINAIVIRNKVLFCSGIAHVTLTFDLETCTHCCRCGLPSHQFLCFYIGRFVLALLANTCQTRHVTLRPSPLTLEVTARRLSLIRIFVLRLCTKFDVGLPVRKILGIYCVSINPHGDLEDLWPLNSKTVSLLVCISQFSFPTPSLNTLGSFVFELCCGQTDRQTDWLENPTNADRQISTPVQKFIIHHIVMYFRFY